MVLSIGKAIHVGQRRTSVRGGLIVFLLHVRRVHVLVPHSIVVAIMRLAIGNGRSWLALLVGIRAHVMRHVVRHAIVGAEVIEVQAGVAHLKSGHASSVLFDTAAGTDETI